jgi:peptide/nickel transport system permease protein
MSAGPPTLTDRGPAIAVAPPVSDTRDRAYADASPARLVWRKFARHKMAVAGLVVLVFIYFVAAFADFLAPANSERFDPDYTYAPPQQLHFLDTNAEGQTTFGLHVYRYLLAVDPATYAMTFEVDPTAKVPVGFFVRGDPYKLFGFIPSDLHFIGPIDPEAPFYLLGADRIGRDMLSRIIHGTRVSMSIGLVGVLLAFVFGVTLGGISGYFGGWVDTVIQRVVEFVMSIPSLPLWLGLAAALPTSWDPLHRYFAITVILAGVAWTDLARVVRGRFLALRTEEFVIAAQIDGNSRMRIIFRHMLPSFTSHLVASLTLSIPGMILAETALSFLGLGLQPPIVSWGVLMQEAQNIRSVATAPWQLWPAAAIVLAVLALNFVGDGVRDAADPYKQ